MDFGFVPVNQLAEVDFTLPIDGLITQTALNKKERVSNPAIYVGCAKWGRKDWVGMIYPEKTKESNFLDEYVKHFNSIELNAIFYGIPRKEQIQAWRKKAEVRNDFKFCPKISRNISHIKRLKNVDEDTNRYLESIYEFGEFLGPVFLQLSESFDAKNFQVLKSYLENFPQDIELFVEVRHKDWLENQAIRKDFFEMLHKLKKGAVITDTSGRRDCVHMELPVSKAFIRFVGNGLHATDYTRIDEWVERLYEWINKGVESVYFFLHQHDEKDTPILADYTIKKFNEKLGTSLGLPKFISKNQLFT